VPSGVLLEIVANAELGFRVSSTEDVFLSLSFLRSTGHVYPRFWKAMARMAAGQHSFLNYPVCVSWFFHVVSSHLKGLSMILILKESRSSSVCLRVTRSAMLLCNAVPTEIPDCSVAAK
jgi:hypothetical protein